MHRLRIGLVIWFSGGLLLLAGPTLLHAQGTPASGPLSISSTAFGNNAAIPAQYACPNRSDPNGGGTSPPLTIANVPPNARSLVLTVDDPDAPFGPNPTPPNQNGGWVHWVVYNLPVNTTSIPEGVAPAGAAVGVNDYGLADYRGPCPPPNTGTHRYFFRLSALDREIAPSITAPNTAPTKEEVDSAMSVPLATATLVGTFTAPTQ